MALDAKFRIERQIGAGGMGVVYEALEPALDRKVAIKVLRPEAATAQATVRFLREARVLARLKHSNVVTVHQAGEADGLLWFAMDLVEGETLAERLTRGPLSPPEASGLARDLLAALWAAHQLDIIHRDIKPSNIFLNRGRALLADFGIARTLTHDSGGSETRTRETLGTPAFMSPEQALGQTVTAASDLYSLALVLYLCLTGRPWPPLRVPQSGDWADIPRAFRPAIQRALELSPSDRWATAAEFAHALTAGPRPARWLVPLAGLGLIVSLWIGWPDPPLIYSGPDGPGPNALPRGANGLREWSHAESLYFAGSWREAHGAYRSTLQRDSACLACEFRIIELDRWLEQKSDTARLGRLLASADRFDEPWRDLVRAIGTPSRDRLDRLETLAQKDYRDFGLGRYYLGAELFNRGPLFGRRRRDGADVLRDLAQRIPDFAPVWYDLTLASIAEGDSTRAQAGLAHLRTHTSAGLAHAQRLLATLAFTFRFTAQGIQLWQQIRQDTLFLTLPEVSAGPRLLNGLGVPQGAVALGHEFEIELARPRLRRSGLIAQMLGQVALGRPAEARQTGQRLASAFPGSSTELFIRSLSATSLLLDESASELDLSAARADLEPLARPGNPASVRTEAAWLISLLSLRLDPASTSFALAGSESAAGSGNLLVRASILAARGKPDSALTLTENLSTDLEAWDRSERSPILRTVLRMSRPAGKPGLEFPRAPGRSCDGTSISICRIIRSTILCPRKETGLSARWRPGGRPGCSTTARSMPMCATRIVWLPSGGARAKAATG